MWTVMAIVVAATILGSSVDAFAMAGGSKKNRGGGGGEAYSGGGEASYSTYEGGTWENGSNYVASTPEPATLILLASGAAGLALWVRRRK
jgi:phospholipase/lecithinase/hemolysin